MNVLILTDFSETSDNAGRYAVDFLQDTAVNFYLLNIHSFNFNRSASETLENELIVTLSELQKKVESLEKYTRNKKHKFHTQLSSENLISAVRKALLEKKIDLIFIGAVSQNEHAHPILGDHAYDVVRKIKCNILAIPGNCEYKLPKKVVFPINHAILSKNEQKKVYNDIDLLKSSDFYLIDVKEDDLAFREGDTAGGQKDAPVKFSSELFSDIQLKFDMIFVIAKNLNICDRLLHTKYGLSAKMNISIPIFVYHGNLN